MSVCPSDSTFSGALLVESGTPQRPHLGAGLQERYCGASYSLLSSDTWKFGIVKHTAEASNNIWERSHHLLTLAKNSLYTCLLLSARERTCKASQNSSLKLMLKDPREDVE